MDLIIEFINFLFIFIILIVIITIIMVTFLKRMVKSFILVKILLFKENKK